MTCAHLLSQGDLTHRRPAVYGSTPPASRVTSLSASTASQDEIENANGFPASTNHTHSPDIYRCNDCTQDFSQAKLLKQVRLHNLQTRSNHSYAIFTSKAPSNRARTRPKPL